MNVTSDLRFTMRRILAVVAILTLAGAGIGVGPSSAAEECHGNSCVTADVIPTSDGWSVHLLMRGAGSSAGYSFYNMLMPGHPQIELQGTTHDLRVLVAAGWDGVFSVQACINNAPLGSHCDTWSTFRAELPIAADDRNFCIRYAGHATSEATAVQQQNCGFDSPPGRWSTDNSAHLNWCLSQFRGAGGVANKLVAARNVANSEDAARVDGLKTCQANAAAATKAYADQRAYEIQVTGKNAAECATSNQACEARIRVTFGSLNAIGMIASECAPYLPVCLANAAASEEAWRAQREYEIQVTGKTAAECATSNQACEARIRVTFGSLNAIGMIASECAPYLPVCLANAAAAIAAAAPAGATPAPGLEEQPPAPVGGGAQTASTCGLPGGTATVAIADPAITELNVRDKPLGQFLGRIPEGTQVNVVGGCGVQLAAGIVAQPGGSQPPVPGWCAISAPMIGCVAEQFLVAGIPAGGQAGLPPAAGIVATQPQTAPQPPPPVAAVEPPAAAEAGGLVARLKQGANIRNGPNSKKTTVLGSLPAGSIVTVVECTTSWCRLALPAYPVAWVSKGFLEFGDFGGAAPPASLSVTIEVGGGQQAGGGAAPPPAQAEQAPLPAVGQQTASTCGLAGTATVVIADPKVTTLNVRDKPQGQILSRIPEGTQVNVVGGCGVQLAAGIVAQPGGGQPPIPGWCAISAPSIGCVSEQFLVAGIPAGGEVGLPPAAGIVATEPQAATAPTFAGTWNAEAQGSSYTFTLNQDGNTVNGSYTGSDGSNGQLNGSVSGNKLRFRWAQADGLSGAGKFALSGDGNSFTGSYTLGNDPNVAEGSWNGTRM